MLSVAILVEGWPAAWSSSDWMVRLRLANARNPSLELGIQPMTAFGLPGCAKASRLEELSFPASSRMAMSATTPSGRAESARAAPWNASASPRPLIPARPAASGVVSWPFRWDTMDLPLR